MEQPSLTVLSQFCKPYFRGRPPSVRWKRMKDTEGYSDLTQRVIYINPKQSTIRFSCRIGLGAQNLKARKVKVNKWESYFATLLHEIGHFKFKKMRIPRIWIAEKKRLQKEWPRDFEMQANDTDPRRLGRGPLAEQDFTVYLKFGPDPDFVFPSLHLKVENWALKRFQKRRQFINSLRN